ncbi:hypothetical protein MJO28_011858 [Puccinia striiformis f. sp. tritici]|uniref:Uncharacterized protein n=3 Tax=Puccinia striiformis TaxID=27350 RepID=A0A0L0W049_9BASI|nr:hypothetical protein Pst134EA_021427 [Puccinia striiformis f. sp. tritici]KNF04847.1 hypothetical protein PSTG_01901 [Puccinia striiformis f. sp. tritici PST-78]POW03392.1 hypothetical protein PSTT_11132 [Puccinia striiformis]KAH9457554.1 hypothetical protein Pst134EA_021427 [Puccinia striiformis f. sp. tritici]KAI7944330.1 hypothetical protein MJO28_011858 [Puccinia striiformis f. sp. tritici]KAI7947087.1 hypothetical protein MJO29_011614 [Puccinia striiformis f. sp. tritici]
MHHTFLAAALLVFTNVLAQDPSLSTNGPAPGTSAANADNSNLSSTTTPSTPNPAPGVGNTGTPAPAKGPKPISVKCTNTHLPFSKRELAEMAQMDASSGTAGNTVPATPDPKTLSDVQTAAICKNDLVTAVCELHSCNVTTSPPPVCQSCYEFTPNPNGDEGIVGTVLTQQVICEDSYNFNKTDVKTPNVCSDKNQKTFSCGSCTGERACDVCYDVKDIPTNPNTTPNPSGPTPPTTPTTPTTPPTTTTATTPSPPTTSNTPTTPTTPPTNP